MNQSFLSLMASDILLLERTHHYALARNYGCAARQFSAFLAGMGLSDIAPAALSAILLKRFQEWLWLRGVSRNTSSCYMRSLRAVMNRHLAGSAKRRENPFAAVYTGVAATRKRAIACHELRRLISLDLDSVRTDANRPLSMPEKERLRFARDMFIFSFCARGIAFVDLAFLRKSNLKGNLLVYKRRKTGQEIEVFVEPLMLTIINRYAAGRSHSPYLLPIIHSTDPLHADGEYQRALRRYNHALHKLSLLTAIDTPLTSYVSRHSWATFAHHNHVSLAIISQSMGHSSEQTTAIYLKQLESNEINRTNRLLLRKLWKGCC